MSEVMDPAALAQIVRDARLTPDALRLVLMVATMGEGEHEISNDEMRAALGCKSDRPVYTARERAARIGYIRWRQGGRNHANLYTYLGPCAEVSAHTSDPVQRYPVPIEDADDALTPVVPLHPVSPDADDAIEKHAELLHGCRDSLRDYLRRRVTPTRQSSFVHDVAGKLNGLGFAWRTDDGSVVPPGERVGLMSAAINELAATDEKSGYRYPPGDPRNLRTKLGILTARWGKKPSRSQSTGTDGPPGRRRAVFDDGEYGEGTTDWKGFNG